jgi:superfamily I DNA and/or RNA helicase
MMSVVAEDADIVCSTLSGTGSPQMLESIMNSSPSLSTQARGFRFDAVIIDEAAQAVEPSALIPLKFNPKVMNQSCSLM